MERRIAKIENLDKLCAEYGYKFADEVSKADKFDAKKAETFLTKALGVSQEQGLYAFVLFCDSRGSGEKNGAEKIKEITEELLKDKLNPINDEDLLTAIRKKTALPQNLKNLCSQFRFLKNPSFTPAIMQRLFQIHLNKQKVNSTKI